MHNNKIFSIIILLFSLALILQLHVNNVNADPNDLTASLVKQVGSVTLPDSQALKAPTITVINLAVDPPQATDIDDGLTWSPAQNRIELGQTVAVTNNQGKSVNMGFTFGGWDDTTISGQLASSRKANIFLHDGQKDNGTPNNIQAFYGGVSLGPSTSVDYALLDELATSIGQTGGVLQMMSNLTYFVSKDASGRVQAVKLMGYLRYGALEMEEVLRTSRYSEGGVAQELYVKNVSTTPQNYVVTEGEDTRLENQDQIGSYVSDRVPVYALGDQRGMYIQSPNHRLNINTDVTDGPKHWLAGYYGDYIKCNTSGVSTSSYGTAVFKGSSLADATGQEVGSYPAGFELLPKSNGSYPDSAYALLWPATNLAVGQTKHYAVDLGINASAYSKPWLTETWRNLSRSDGKNYPQDQMEFEVTLGNDGFTSAYQTTSLTDLVPSDFQVTSATITYANGQNKTVAYNAANRGLQLSPTDAILLKDNQKAKITFLGTINASANGTTLSTTPKATAVEQNLSSHPTSDFYGSTLSIPVEKLTFSATLAQTAVDRTRSLPTNYYVPGDTIDFCLDYQIAADSTATAPQLVFTPQASAGLKFANYVFASDGSNDSDLVTTFMIDQTNANWPQTIVVKKRSREAFKAGDHFRLTITGVATGNLSGAHNSSYQTLRHNVNVSAPLNSGQVNTINVQTLILQRANFAYFTEIPTTIDFGKVVNAGQSLTNRATTGALKVNSYFQSATAQGYEIRVAYDNTGSQRLTNGSVGLTPRGTSLLSYRAQPILSSGNRVAQITPSSGTSTGINERGIDLTNLVGANQWQLNAQRNALPGDYKGTLTWSIVNSL